MRGYGQTDKPEAIDQYTLLHLTGDMVGLVEALGFKEAVIVGHDWGAPVAWYSALFRPDKFKGVVGLSVPFRPRGDTCVRSSFDRRGYRLRGSVPRDAALLRRLLSENRGHRPRLHKLFLESFAVAAGQRHGVMLRSHGASKLATPLRAIAQHVGHARYSLSPAAAATPGASSPQ